MKLRSFVWAVKGSTDQSRNYKHALLSDPLEQDKINPWSGLESRTWLSFSPVSRKSYQSQPYTLAIASGSRKAQTSWCGRSGQRSNASKQLKCWSGVVLKPTIDDVSGGKNYLLPKKDMAKRGWPTQANKQKALQSPNPPSPAEITPPQEPN